MIGFQMQRGLVYGKDFRLNIEISIISYVRDAIRILQVDTHQN